MCLAILVFILRQNDTLSVIRQSIALTILLQWLFYIITVFVILYEKIYRVFVKT